MPDRPALNEQETQAREALVGMAAAMLDGNLSFFEGAVEVLRLRSAIGGVSDRDPDFDAFVAIESETDHLPLKAQHHLWNANALADLQSEFQRTEMWAAGFAPDACRGLIERFGRPQY
ncbi:MAG: hypothetical protein RIS44_1169 [Pseudomonadota bacterium]|jgi:hypothetical protein